MSKNFLNGGKNAGVCLLRVDITQKSQDHDSSLNDDIGLGVFDEGAVFYEVFVSDIDVGSEVDDLVDVLGTLFAKRHVYTLNTEVAGHSYSSINIIAEAFE